MNDQAIQLPSYITSATPNPAERRAAWYKNTAPTYAGIFLWFVFWQDAAKANSLGGALSQGLWLALGSLVLAALVCHYLFYLVPGLFGLRTGLPLYIVGTSTFGAQGGFIMPGFLMGVLQFGWLGVNVCFSSLALAEVIPVDAKIIMVVWGLLAAFVGLKGIQYVAKVATYLPLIPLVILIWLFVKTASGLGSFDPASFIQTQKDLGPTVPSQLGAFGVIAAVLTYVVGFFATAGAAGVDFGTNSRDKNDVSMGGLIGIALAIILTAGLSMCVVAGAFGSQDLGPKVKATAAATVEKAEKDADDAAKKEGKALTDKEKNDIINGTSHEALCRSTSLIKVVLSDKLAGILMFLLALAAFPGACFSSFIAANSFKTVMPKVNPFISVGLGAALSIILAVTGLAGKVIPVFVIIGASFGPICGAMMVDYLLSKGTWTGPRSGFNPAGWIAWGLGFVVGILPNLGVDVPAAPVAAFIVGAVVYFICAKAGLQSAVIPMPEKK